MRQAQAKYPRLKEGETIIFEGEPWRVTSVTNSRAVIKCKTTREVTVQGRTFEAHSGRCVSISPFSEVERWNP
jgi:translation elongation factor P/translation initiation factor 5A